MPVQKIIKFFEKDLWTIDLGPLGRQRTFLIKTLRLIYVGIREISGGQLTMRAMALVYPTLLSLVPLLAVSFSVLKAFGVHNLLRPTLLRFLSPLGPEAEELTRTIVQFVENLSVGVLGSIGLVLLIYTVVSLIAKVEDAFSYIWKVRRPRSVIRRVSDYTSAVLLGPVLIFSSLWLTSSVMKSPAVAGLIAIRPLGLVVYLAGKLAPYVFVCAWFTLIYILLPSTKVKFRSALFGGVLAGFLWETTAWAFASFLATSVKYPAIYAGLAALLLFIIWLYLNWLILFAGAQVSFYHQYPNFLVVKKEAILLSNRLKEKLAFLIMFLIGDNYYNNRPHWKLNSLVDRLGLPVEPVLDVLNMLEKKGWIVESGDEPPAYMPARDMETIGLKELLGSIRVVEEAYYTIEEKFIAMPEVDGLIKKLDDATASALGGETLRSLVVKK